MGKRNEISKQGISEAMTMEEQQLYEDVRLILHQAREQAYSNASAIMIYKSDKEMSEEAKTNVFGESLYFTMDDIVQMSGLTKNR